MKSLCICSGVSCAGCRNLSGKTVCHSSCNETASPRCAGVCALSDGGVV